MFSHASSVQFICSVVSNSLRPHGQQHVRPSCPSPTPGVYSNSCSLSQWCHLTISPFSFCLQSFPASGSFQMSQFFISGGQSIRVSASASVLSKNIQDWFPLGWTGWISLQRRDSQESSPTPQFKSINSSALSFHVHPYMTTGKTIALTIRTFVGKVISLLFNMLSRFDFPGSSDGKASVYNAGDLGSIPGLGRSAGEGNGNPLQYYCLENPMDSGAW